MAAVVAEESAEVVALEAEAEADVVMLETVAAKLAPLGVTVPLQTGVRFATVWRLRSAMRALM